MMSGAYYIVLITALSAIIAWAQAAIADHDSYKSDRIGEYYEYDIEGSAKQRARRKARHRAQKIMAAPFKASWGAVSFSASALKKTVYALEVYLSGHRQLAHNKGDINKALTDWQGALRFKVHEQNQENTATKPGLWYIPRESWRLFKYSLYMAGFRLPREIKKTLKNMIYGTCGFNAQEY